MQFKHPEILGFLLFLAIPIIIHLFQLQRFRKEAFTNIKFLKQIEAASRKRKKLKDLLILATRLLALACVIIAFAQPYNSEKQAGKEKEIVLYIDNSFSMQARGPNGVELFQNLKSELLEDLRQSNVNYHLVTNHQILANLDLDQLKKEVLRLDYAPNGKPLGQVLLETETIKKNNPAKDIEIFLLSDFFNVDLIPDSASVMNSSAYHLLPLSPVDRNNVSLDSVWVSMEETEEVIVETSIKSHGMQVPDQSISLTIDDELYGKASVNLEPGEAAVVSFSLPKTLYGKGKVEINDHRIFFDNQLFFTLGEKERKDVLILGHKDESLEKIYRPADFNLTVSEQGQEDQSIIQDQDLIILNGYSDLTAPLAKSLEEFVRSKGNLVIIPPPEAEPEALEKLLSNFLAADVENRFSSEREITGIAYDHPFFEKVFTERVRNFQYPKVNSGWLFNIQNSNDLLTYADGSAFLSQIPYNEQNIFVFSTSLEEVQSNFRRSPLIVPVFYNFARKDKDPFALYMLIGKKNEFTIALEVPSRDAAKLSDGRYEFIPVQSLKENMLEITTLDFPEMAGHYAILLSGDAISNVAYNHNRAENLGSERGFELARSSLPEAKILDTTKKAFRSINVIHKGSSLWQYFITFALVFLMMELLIQKFFKG